jgi:hypothetical protein
MKEILKRFDYNYRIVFAMDPKFDDYWFVEYYRYNECIYKEITNAILFYQCLILK